MCVRVHLDLAVCAVTHVSTSGQRLSSPRISVVGTDPALLMGCPHLVLWVEDPAPGLCEQASLARDLLL